MAELTALQYICDIKTPDAALNTAIRHAKDNMARTMRWYSLGWGMSNAPHVYTTVVGRDTGWMTVGANYVAPWFGAPALAQFRDRQKSNGQIVEYIDLESGKVDDYGLNIADNTPLYAWAVNRYWQQFADERFHATFLPSMKKAGDYLVDSMGPRDLLVGIPAGTGMQGIISWRNIIEGAVIAGEVTEINSLVVMALREIADFTGAARYAEAADRIAAAINRHLWTGSGYALTCRDGVTNVSETGDMIFPLISGVAPADRARIVLDRLWREDFRTSRGLRTVPCGATGYHPSKNFGLTGGSWPNLTLWYAAAAAPYDADRALEAFEMVFAPVVADGQEAQNITQGDFPEWFDGETGVNLGMRLSPWVAPTLMWAVLEGLLGLTWRQGVPSFSPRWPENWSEVSIQRLPCGSRETNVKLNR